MPSSCENNSEFQETIDKLGNTLELFETVFNNIQQFMNQLYNPAKTEMGAPPYVRFYRKIKYVINVK